MQDEDFGAALETLDRIIALQTEHNLELPPAFWFSHARVANRGGAFRRGYGIGDQVPGGHGDRGANTTWRPLELFNEAERLVAQGIFRTARGVLQWWRSRQELPDGFPDDGAWPAR